MSEKGLGEGVSALIDIGNESIKIVDITQFVEVEEGVYNEACIEVSLEQFRLWAKAVEALAKNEC